MSEIRNNYAVAVVVFHFKAKVYRKKKGLYFVYFKHYRHPKGEKVQRGKVWFHLVVPTQYLYFKHYVLPQRQYMYLRQIKKKKKI